MGGRCVSCSWVCFLFLANASFSVRECPWNTFWDRQSLHDLGSHPRGLVDGATETSVREQPMRLLGDQGEGDVEEGSWIDSSGQ